jgi:hypothetical protein
MRNLWLVLSFVALPAFAETMVCQVHDVKDRPELKNSIFKVDMDTIESTLTLESHDSTLPDVTLQLITKDVVSQFGSPRSSCQYKIEESRHTKTGVLYEIQFKFATCKGPQTASTVFAQVDLNLETHKGVYEETLLQLGPKSLALQFDGCYLQ